MPKHTTNTSFTPNTHSALLKTYQVDILIGYIKYIPELLFVNTKFVFAVIVLASFTVLRHARITFAH